jgi:hypothetical protein
VDVNANVHCLYGVANVVITGEIVRSGEWEQEKQHAVEPVHVYEGRVEEKQIV